MICITRQGTTALTLEGHACSDAFGKDLVCAAVSALLLTLETNMEQMHRKGQLRSARVHLEPGNARLRCTPRKEHRPEAEAVFDHICLGFQMLAKRFPGYVCYLEQ